MSKILTRRNLLKAGLIGATLLVGGKLTYDCYSRQSNISNSGLVKKLELPAGFETVGIAESSPIALAGHTKDLASFLLMEKGERRWVGKDKPDKLGIYVFDKSEIRRVGDFPVLPAYLTIQGISAIGQGENRYDCLNYNSGSVEVRRTSTKPVQNVSSDLRYRDNGIYTKIEAVSGDRILLRDDGRGEFLFVDSQTAPANYNSVQKLKLPQGEEWEKLEEYMKTNSPKGFEMLISDYIKRESIRAKVGAELEKARENRYLIMFFPNGITGDYKSAFGAIQDAQGDYRLARKQLENKGDKK